MPEIVLRLTDELDAVVRAEMEHGGYGDAEAFIQALVMDHADRRLARVRALMEASDAASLDALREATRRRYREGGA
jgi:Arc/MetJ-type ribon-helix-helix transcriptional regulator